MLNVVLRTTVSVELNATKTKTFFKLSNSAETEE